MHELQKYNARRIPLTRKFRIMRRYALLCGIFLVTLGILYVFLFGVQNSRAAETLACMSICPMGVNPCTPVACANPPSVVTALVTLITSSSALGHGNVISSGGGTVTERGIVAATTTDPTVNDLKFAAATAGVGEFSASLTALATSTTYYARAYAINAADTGYGTTTSFMTLAETVPVVPSTTPTFRPGGGHIFVSPPAAAIPETPTSTITLSDYLIPGHAIQNIPYSSVETIRNVENGRFISIDSQGVFRITSRIFAIEGTTNMKDAQIYIHLQSKSQYATVLADGSGHWSWVTAEPLENGSHTLTILAVSPYDDRVRQTMAYTVIVESRSALDVIPGISQPGSSGGVQLDDLKRDYILDLKVLSEPETISKEGYIDLRTDIKSLTPETAEQAYLTYTVYDIHGIPLFSETKSLFVKGSSADYSRALLREALKPGTYVVEVKLTFKDHVVTSTEEFEVRSHPILATPIATLTYQDSRAAIQGGIGMLSLTLAGLLFFMYREYKSAQYAVRQVNDLDLLQGDMIR